MLRLTLHSGLAMIAETCRSILRAHFGLFGQARKRHRLIENVHKIIYLLRVTLNAENWLYPAWERLFRLSVGVVFTENL